MIPHSVEHEVEKARAMIWGIDAPWTQANKSNGKAEEVSANDASPTSRHHSATPTSPTSPNRSSTFLVGDVSEVGEAFGELAVLSAGPSLFTSRIRSIDLRLN